MYVPECFSFVRKMIGCFCYPPHICCAGTGLLHLPFPRGLQLSLVLWHSFQHMHWILPWQSPWHCRQDKHCSFRNHWLVVGVLLFPTVCWLSPSAYLLALWVKPAYFYYWLLDYVSFPNWKELRKIRTSEWEKIEYNKIIWGREPKDFLTVFQILS